MKVTAKCWIKYDGVWHIGGETFEVDDIEPVKEYVEPVGFISEVFPPAEEAPETPKRGRKKKTETE